MAEVKIPNITVTGIGNVLAGLALAFLVDGLALNHAVSDMLPPVVRGFLGLVIFAGAAVYGYRAAKRTS